MPVTIGRTAWTDDDGSGTTGTVINNAAKTEIYDQIDTALALLLALSGGTVTGATIFSALVTLTGGQLKFPSTQVPSTDVNTLDDYEEGSWTPVLGGDGGTSGQTYVSQAGAYIKIGKLVWATFIIELSAKGTITGNIQIQGLPFTLENVATMLPVCPLVFHQLATNQINLVLRGVSNTTAAYVLGNTAAATSNLTLKATADIANNTILQGTMLYRASA